MFWNIGGLGLRTFGDPSAFALGSLKFINILPGLQRRASMHTPRTFHTRPVTGSPGRRLSVLIRVEWRRVRLHDSAFAGQLDVSLDAGVEELLHIVRHCGS